jgi:hypothetical protein
MIGVLRLFLAPLTAQFKSKEPGRNPERGAPTSVDGFAA